MSLGQWYVSRGRITRRTFWLHYVLPLIALSVLAEVADLAAGTRARPGAGPGVPAPVQLTAP